MNWTLVTGAAGGLGATIADALAEAGHRVVIHYRTSKPKGAHPAVWGDFSTAQGIEAFLTTLGQDYPLSCVVNNVGPYVPTLLANADAAEWNGIWTSNLLAPALLGQALVDQNGHSIVHIGVAGLLARRIIGQCPLYSVLKHALWALTRAQAKEWANRPIRVNMVSPGQLETSRDLVPEGSLEPEDLPMGRAATLQEVAQVVVDVLAHPYVTGQNIEVAGGYAL